MDSTPSTATKTKSKGTTAKLPIILTDISAILGLLMLIMSFAYLFIAVSVTKHGNKAIRECSCKKNRNFGAISTCLTGTHAANGYIVDGNNKSLDFNTLESSQSINRFCRNMTQEIAAGTLGILFGLFQTAAASVFLLAGVPDALKFIWIVVHAVIAFVCTVIVLLVFDVTLYKILNRSKIGTSIYFPNAFLHDGAPTTVKKGNTVLFVYFAFVVQDVVATISGIVFMVLTKRAGRVGNAAKPTSKDGPTSEPTPAMEARGSAAALPAEAANQS